MPDQAGEGWPLLQSQSFQRACQEVELADGCALTLQGRHPTRSTDAVEITIDGPESSISKPTFCKETSSSTGWGMGLMAGNTSTTTSSGNRVVEGDYSEVNSALRPGPAQRDGAASQVRDGEAKASSLTAPFSAVASPASHPSGLPLTLPLSTADVIAEASSPRHPLSPPPCSACTCIGGVAGDNGARGAGSSRESGNLAEVEQAESAGNSLFQTEVTIAEEPASSPGRAEDGGGLMRACGLIGGGASSAQQSNPTPQGSRARGGRRRRRAAAARGAGGSAIDEESGEAEGEGPGEPRPLSVVIHGPGASFFVGTELVAAGGRGGPEGSRGSAGAQGDRGDPGGSRQGTESAQAAGADSGEDNYSNGYGDSEYDSDDGYEQEGEGGRRRRRGRRRIQVLMDQWRGGVDAVVRWGRNGRAHTRGRALAGRGPGVSAADGGGASESGDGDSDYDESDHLEDREEGSLHYDECDDNEGYCMECRGGDDVERGAEEGQEERGRESGWPHAEGEGDGGESDSSTISCSSGYSQSSEAESKASADNEADNAGAAMLNFHFAPLLEPSSQTEGDTWIEAVHVVLPPPPAGTRGGWEGVDVSGMEAIFDARCVKWFQRVKRLFIAMLLLGSVFYIVSFIAGVLANRGKSAEQGVVAANPAAEGQGQAAMGLDSNFDYVSHAMLTSSNIWVAMAYLVLYLSLDMIGFAGAILENVSLLTLYIVVELIITFISALEALRPFLLFRLLVILLALRLRYSALKVEDAERRLFSRLMGRPMPPPNRRTWLARLGIFPGTLSAMFRHAPLSRFQLRGRPWYAELVRLHTLRLQQMQRQQQQHLALQQQRERRWRQEERWQQRQRRQQRRQEHRQQEGEVDVQRGGAEGRVERGGVVEEQGGMQQQVERQDARSEMGQQRNADNHPHHHHHHHHHHQHHCHEHDNQLHAHGHCTSHQHHQRHHHHHHCTQQQHGQPSSCQPLIQQQQQAEEAAGDGNVALDVGRQEQGCESEQVAQEVVKHQHQHQQQEDEQEAAAVATSVPTTGLCSGNSTCTPCPRAAACNAAMPVLPTAGAAAAMLTCEPGVSPLGSPDASDRFSIDITDMPHTAQTWAEPERAAEAGEEGRECEALLAARLLLPPPFPLVPHLPVPRTPSSSLPPSRSISLTHQQPSSDTDVPDSPSAIPPSTPLTLMSSPLPPLPSTAT
ncbi:hypothetical protein CLOM_g19284 [Closterium sp. NIES-68]|nr:hypothetical protein CLOM_g19284 [Closterium sp. NIES-68]GJP58903.1 hypothetical protein CLOP_g6677 [Closterium sp. NIES-67]